MRSTKRLIATKSQQLRKYFSDEIYNLETGESYSSRFHQDAVKIALHLRQRWKLLTFATSCLMLLILAPAAMTACHRRLTNILSNELPYSQASVTSRRRLPEWPGKEGTTYTDRHLDRDALIRKGWYCVGLLETRNVANYKGDLIHLNRNKNRYYWFKPKKNKMGSPTSGGTLVLCTGVFSSGHGDIDDWYRRLDQMEISNNTEITIEEIEHGWWSQRWVRIKISTNGCLPVGPYGKSIYIRTEKNMSAGDAKKLQDHFAKLKTEVPAKSYIRNLRYYF